MRDAVYMAEPKTKVLRISLLIAANAIGGFGGYWLASSDFGFPWWGKTLALAILMAIGLLCYVYGVKKGLIKKK
jgi:hypothetical protein